MKDEGEEARQDNDPIVDDKSTSKKRKKKKNKNKETE